MLVEVTFLPPSFLPSRTFYIIKKQNCVYFCNRVYIFEQKYCPNQLCDPVSRIWILQSGISTVLPPLYDIINTHNRVDLNSSHFVTSLTVLKSRIFDTQPGIPIKADFTLWPCVLCQMSIMSVQPGQHVQFWSTANVVKRKTRPLLAGAVVREVHMLSLYIPPVQTQTL